MDGDRIPADQVTGITRKRWTGLVMIWLAVSLPFALMYLTSRRVVIQEIRARATTIARAAAQRVDAARLVAVQGFADQNTPTYRELQDILAQVRDAEPVIRYAYIMRRSRQPFAPPTSYEYVADAPARDFNGNGVIDRDEESELPGTGYDASRLPALVAAWDGPSADFDISRDAPYPDLLSAYAPIRDAEGRAVAVIGVDVLASTVGSKLMAVRVVMSMVWLVTSVLITLVIHLYYQQRDAYERIKRLNEDLTNRNELLRRASEAMAQQADHAGQELKLAQAVQAGFLPTRFPRQDRIIFDKYYLTCATLGGDLFDAFDVDHEHVGMFMADVAGRGVSAALISGLLKMAISSVREQSADATDTMYADLTDPGAFLRVLNDLLVKEMPEGEFITLIYAVVRLPENKVLMASAGHPWPVLYRARTRSHEVCPCRHGLALGLERDQEYPVCTIDVGEGDKLVFHTNGLTEAMNAEGELFGLERFHALVGRHGTAAPADIVAALRKAVDEFRHGQDVIDDYSLLVVAIR
jgi:serine phosphatase RsbU (regulator of sigma subunit)